MSKFTYEFTLENGEVYKFTVDLDNPRKHPKKESAFGTRLDFHKCQNCPLAPEEHTHCPVAIDIEEVAEHFKDILSFERVHVRVRSEERDYLKVCDVQTALKSLLGLIMASGRCPILSQLTPMAHYHLPFASVEETIYRVVGAYLIKQYFMHREGEKPDLELQGLRQLYSQLQIVNKDFMTRIRAASSSDANLNAINILFSLSAVVAITILDKLDQMKPMFFNDPPGLDQDSTMEQVCED